MLGAASANWNSKDLEKLAVIDISPLHFIQKRLNLGIRPALYAQSLTKHKRHHRLDSGPRIYHCLATAPS